MSAESARENQLCGARRRQIIHAQLQRGRQQSEPLPFDARVSTWCPLRALLRSPRNNLRTRQRRGRIDLEPRGDRIQKRIQSQWMWTVADSAGRQMCAGHCVSRGQLDQRATLAYYKGSKFKS